MNRVTLSAFAVLVALGVFSTLWLQGEPAGPAALEDVAEAPIAEPARAELEQPSSPADAPETTEAATRREAVARTLTPSLVVEVVHAATKEPVPNATVGVLREGDGPHRGPGPLDWNDFLDARRTATADQRGRAVFALPVEGEFFLTAFRDGLAGEPLAGGRRVEPGEESPLKIEVTPRWPLEVRVVDREGRPVPDALVGLRGPRSSFFWDPRVTARTRAPDGIASFRFVETLLRGELQAEFVALEVPCDPIVAVPLTESRAEIIELVHPPSGSVRVRLLEPGGELVRHPYSLVLTWHDGGGSRMLARSFSIVEAGVLEIDPVGLNLDFNLYDEHAQNEHQGLRYSGPRVAGERLVVDYTLPPGRWVRARLVDEELRPYVHEPVSVSFAASDGFTKTNELGELFLFLREDQADAPFGLSVEVSAARASGQWTALIPGPDGDLGDLTLARPAVRKSVARTADESRISKVRGTLLLPEGMPASAVTVLVTDPRAGTSRPRGSAFEFATQPGRHDISVSIARTRAKLLSFSFTAREGPTTLDPIDLRPLVEVHVIDIADTEGRPLASGVLEVLPYGTRHEGSRVTLATRAGQTLDLRARADGHRIQTAEGVRGRHGFVLETGLPIRIRFHEVPLEREHLLVRLITRHEAPSRLLGTADELQFRLSAPGPCNILMSDQRYGVKRNAAGDTPRPLTIEVLDRAEEQVFDVAWGR